MGSLCPAARQEEEQQTTSSISLRPSKKIEGKPTSDEQKENSYEEQKSENPKKQNLEKKVIDQEITNTQEPSKQIGKQDFQQLNEIGRGAFGKVFRVKKKDNGKIYAMKIIGKKNIVSHKLVTNTVLERNVLRQNNHPFLVHLKYAFQTNSHLYLVMEFVQGGEFYKILKASQQFPESVARFVAAEVILAIEHLNTQLNIIYRDLKPENILLSSTGHVKLTDFGLSTLRGENKSFTLAGTPEYLAPEVITRQGHSYEVDLWSIGVLIYEMLYGDPPFNDPDRNIQKIQKLILENKVTYPLSMSSEAKDLISKLLKTNPKDRIGVNGYQEIKSHPFFNSIDWEGLLQGKVESPLQKYAEKIIKKNESHYPKNLQPLPETPNGEKFPEANDEKFVGITYNPDQINMQSSYQYTHNRLK